MTKFLRMLTRGKVPELDIQTQIYSPTYSISLKKKTDLGDEFMLYVIVMRKPWPLSVACNGAMGFSSIFDIRQYRTFTGKKLICSSPSETSHNHDRSVIDTNLRKRGLILLE